MKAIRCGYDGGCLLIMTDQPKPKTFGKFIHALEAQYPEHYRAEAKRLAKALQDMINDPNNFAIRQKAIVALKRWENKEG